VLKRLLDSASAAERGEGRVAIVFGEPGSGKSVLVRELMRLIQSERPRVCLTRVYRGDAAAPYAPWRALLADQP
jgi:ABC-type proline/glycine betaine transport system ATPase subunit